MDGHQLAERRSLAYHALVAERLDDGLVARARARVDGWLDAGPTHPTYAAFWRELLDRPLDELRRALIDPGPSMTAARQCSPFAGALSPRERWAVWRGVTSAP